MDPFRLCLALGPVAIYMLLMGMINLGRRPLLVSGMRDATALGLALSGLVIVGPLHLFFPDTIAAHVPPEYIRYLWVFLVAMYGLGLFLLLLTLRPRLVIYNMSVDQLRPILAEVVDRLDPEARWAGDSLMLPAVGVQLHLENMAFMRNVSLVSTSPTQNEQGWGRLESALRRALRSTSVPRNPRGVTFMSIGLFIGGALTYAIVEDPQAIARAMFDMLQWHP